MQLQALLPDPEAKPIKRAGHYHVLARPEAFVEVLLDWEKEEVK